MSSLTFLGKRWCVKKWKDIRSIEDEFAWLDSNHFQIDVLCVPYGSTLTKSDSVLSVGFLFHLISFRNDMNLYWKWKNQYAKYFKQMLGPEYISETVGNNHSIKSKASGMGMGMWCSPLYCLNYREGLKFHWRFQPTMGSRSIASILFSCDRVCFWGVILEGKCCYSFFFFPLNQKLYMFICSYYIT